MIDFGVTRQEFCERFFEKSCYLRKRALVHAAWTWADIEALLHQIEPTAQGVQLFRDGLVPEEAYIEPVPAPGAPRSRLNQPRFHALMMGGATLVINRLETLSERTQQLCTEVSRFAGYPSIGNAYVAFGGAGAFGRHWDTHDVFVFQLIGRKRWQIFPPTFPFPLSMHTTRNVGHECPQTPVVDCTLEAGDLLYIPRGWWHHVLPLQEGSLHLSVGTYAPSVLDYVMWVCSRYGSREIPARLALTEAVSADDIAAVMREISTAVANPAHRAEFRRDAAAPSPLATP